MSYGQSWSRRPRGIDLAHGELTVKGKGGKVAVIPLTAEELRLDLERLALERQADPDHYILHPLRITPTCPQGRSYPDRPMQPSTMHRWWARCLKRVGVAHFPMHELRHSAVTEFLRATGDISLAKEFARHANVATTVDVYGHLDRDDLIAGMRKADARW